MQRASIGGRPPPSESPSPCRRGGRSTSAASRSLGTIVPVPPRGSSPTRSCRRGLGTMLHALPRGSSPTRAVGEPEAWAVTWTVAPWRAGPRSSAGQSTGLLIRVAQVRVLPGALFPQVRHVVGVRAAAIQVATSTVRCPSSQRSPPGASGTDRSRVPVAMAFLPSTWTRPGTRQACSASKAPSERVLRPRGDARDHRTPGPSV